MRKVALNKIDYKRIYKELPDTDSVQERILLLDPYFISMKCSHKSKMPIAAVCLLDASHTLQESKFALCKAVESQILYEEKKSPPDLISSIFFRKYYYDDVAFRLYSIGEDIANSIMFMLDIKKEDIGKYRRKHNSQQAVVGNFLKKEKSNHEITVMVNSLVQDKGWKKLVDYRNKIVHEQPPSIKGYGVIYSRENKWQVSKHGKPLKLTFKEEKAEYSINDIFNFVKHSLFYITKNLDDVADYYFKLLNELGVKIDFAKEKVSYSIKFTKKRKGSFRVCRHNC